MIFIDSSLIFNFYYTLNMFLHSPQSITKVVYTLYTNAFIDCSAKVERGREGEREWESESESERERERE